jgi:hypothetical protein
MNIQDALLTRSFLQYAAASTHCTIAELATHYRIGIRRTTNLVLCMEKAGLLYVHLDGTIQPNTLLNTWHRIHVSALAALPAEALRAKRYAAWRDEALEKQSSFAKVANGVPPGAVMDIFSELFGPKKKGRKQ